MQFYSLLQSQGQATFQVLKQLQVSQGGCSESFHEQLYLKQQESLNTGREAELAWAWAWASAEQVLGWWEERDVMMLFVIEIMEAV